MKKTISIIFLIFVFTSCNKLDVFQFITNDQIYKHEVIDTSITAPTGILFYNNYLYVTDLKDSSIYCIDLNGSILKKVGSLGSDRLEFKEPTAITAYDSQIYILDSGNYRIQVLTDELEYIDEIPLPYSYMYYITPYVDLAVSDSGIYVSSGSIDKEYAKIIHIDTQHNQYYVGNELYGFLYHDTSNVYFINSGKIEKLYGLDNLNVNSNSSIYRLEGDKIYEQSIIGKSLYISDFVLLNNDLYYASYNGNAIKKINIETKSLETIIDFSKYYPDNKWSIHSYLDVDLNGNIYVTNREDSAIYKISKNERLP